MYSQTYMNTTAGSYALLGSSKSGPVYEHLARLSCVILTVPSKESTVAANLKAGGAIILGKTNTAEWSGWRGTNVPAGWSARGGQGTGVYVKNQFPAGSSSGSAVAATLGLSFATIGTETNGSIVSVPLAYILTR